MATKHAPPVRGERIQKWIMCGERVHKRIMSGNIVGVVVITLMLILIGVFQPAVG